MGRGGSGGLVKGDAVNATATGGHRINIDLHDLAAGVELGQQIMAVAVSRLVAKLGGDHRTIDRQIVDITGGEVAAAAKTVVPPIERGRQHMQLQLVAVRIGGLLEDGHMLAGHLVVVGFRIVVHIDHHHPGADKAGIEIDVGIGNVLALDAR